jgi:NodT family efflux transporter outer membrane factor (OMF) lipoprotein
MRRIALAVGGGLALGGCTVGPRAPTTTIAMPPPHVPETIAPASGVAQTFSNTTPDRSEWWHAFGSAKLDALVTQLVLRNNDLATAEATLRQAQEQARAAGSGQGPQIDASYQAQHARVSQALSTPLADPSNYLYTLHTAQVTVAYPLDLFGGGRSRVRSARAAAQVAADRLVAARTTAIANLVLAVIQHASLEAQIAATESAIRSNRELVDLLQRRRAIGDAGEADVVAQQTALATIEATLPPLQRQVEHQAGLIETLTGSAAGNALPAMPTLNELRLPVDLPTALPADIIAHRPDVEAAEAQMRGAGADVDTAIAARLPAFQLTGNAGGAATHFLDMFATGNPFYALAGSITQPIFHSGQLVHQQHAAEAALDAAKAQYRVAALQAFLDVDDALAGLQSDAAALDAAARADRAASRSLLLMRRQVELGAQGMLGLLTASSVAAQTSVQLIQARSARLTDTVALYQACGTDVRNSTGRN